MIVGKTTLPEIGILPTTEPRRFGPDPQPVGSRPHARAARAAAPRRRSPPGWCRSRTATTAAARSRIPAACCGLVGLRRRAAGSRRAGRAAQSFLVDRRRADAHGRRDRRGCSTCSPATSPATPTGRRRRRRRSPSGRARRRAGCGSGWRSTRRSTARRSTRSCAAAARDAAALLESLGHDVEEISAAVVGTRAAARLHARRSGRGSSMRIAGRRADRRPRADRGGRRAADAG